MKPFGVTFIFAEKIVHQTEKHSLHTRYQSLCHIVMQKIPRIRTMEGVFIITSFNLHLTNVKPYGETGYSTSTKIGLDLRYNAQTIMFHGEFKETGLFLVTKWLHLHPDNERSFHSLLTQCLSSSCV